MYVAFLPLGVVFWCSHYIFFHRPDYLRGEVMTGMFNYDNPALVTEQNAVMRYAGIPETIMPNDTAPALDGVTQDLDTTLLVPVVPITPPAPTRTETVFVTFEVTAQGSWGAFFNGSGWTPETNGNATVFQTAEATIMDTSFSFDSQYILTNDNIEVFDLIINKSVSLTCFTCKPILIHFYHSQDDGDHPFHLHGHTPWLLGTGDGNYQGQANLTQTNPMRRDTFVIPAYSWGAVRFVTDNPGLWAL
jgi:iron transport multicopper oxidase